MERIPSNGENWSQLQQQRLFTDIAGHLRTRGEAIPYIDYLYGEFDTGVLQHGINATEAVNQLWQNEPETAEEAYLTYTPAHTTGDGAHEPPRIFLAVHSYITPRQPITRDYDMTLDGDVVSGRRTDNIPDNSPETTQEDRLLSEANASGHRMDAHDFDFVQAMFRQL